MRRRFHVVAIALGSLVLAVGAGATTLNGRVYSDAGRPVVGALATVQRTVAIASYTTYRVVTNAQGKFSLTVPDTATYSVCVGSWGDSLLNSCEWSLGQSLVPIAAGQQTASITITLQTGAMLRIRLDDPQGLLPSPTAVTSGTASSSAPSVRFGLWSSDGRYHAAIQVSSDSLGQNHQVLLPLNAALNFSVQASGVQVLNQTGTALAAAGSSIPSVGFQSGATNIAQGMYYQVAKAGN
jgi:hypothetical protein